MSAQTRVVQANGLDMRVVEQGSGPLLLLCHGWPEYWYTWHNQISAIARAGYRVVAPDMRGYGESSAPSDVQSYSIIALVGDVTGLVEALGERSAAIVGHDWGAVVAWAAALMHPDVFPAVVGLSVPFRRQGDASPLRTLREKGLDTYYWFYFQEPGVAEWELERNIHATFRRILAGGAESLILKAGAGLLDNFGDPATLPHWASEELLSKYAEVYSRTGFRGGLNWYRNLERNWELLKPWRYASIRQPALYVAGSRDQSATGPTGKPAVDALPTTVPGLQGSLLIEGAGHFIQRERPNEVNDALLAFLKDHAAR